MSPNAFEGRACIISPKEETKRDNCMGASKVLESRKEVLALFGRHEGFFSRRPLGMEPPAERGLLQVKTILNSARCLYWLVWVLSCFEFFRT